MPPYIHRRVVLPFQKNRTASFDSFLIIWCTSLYWDLFKPYSCKYIVNTFIGSINEEQAEHSDSIDWLLDSERPTFDMVYEVGNGGNHLGDYLSISWQWVIPWVHIEMTSPLVTVFIGDCSGWKLVKVGYSLVGYSLDHLLVIFFTNLVADEPLARNWWSSTQYTSGSCKWCYRYLITWLRNRSRIIPLLLVKGGL